MIIGKGREHVGALIFPNWQELMGYASQEGIPYSIDDPEKARAELSSSSDIKRLFHGEISSRVSLEQGFNRWELVRKIGIIPGELREGIELTPTLKLRRGFVMQQLEDTIEMMYK